MDSVGMELPVRITPIAGRGGGVGVSAPGRSMTAVENPAQDRIPKPTVDHCGPVRTPIRRPDVQMATQVMTINQKKTHRRSVTMPWRMRPSTVSWIAARRIAMTGPRNGRISRRAPLTVPAIMRSATANAVWSHADPAISRPVIVSSRLKCASTERWCREGTGAVLRPDIPFDEAPPRAVLLNVGSGHEFFVR